jgi:hypothetical protein
MPFKKGNKGGGRPKGFKGVARDIMRRTHQAKDLVDFAMQVFTDGSRPLHWRWAAMEWLADRAIGKPMQMLDLAAALEAPEPQPRLDLSVLTDEQRRQMRELLVRALGRPRRIELPIDAPQLEMIDGGAVLPIDRADAEEGGDE